MSSPIWEEADDYCADCYTRDEQLYFGNDNLLYCSYCYEKHREDEIVSSQLGHNSRNK